ncbi:hypothetical protein ACQEVZ_02410 [Dactylosporangium sp. CA-152071]|uniref:hypothetical protein n=1 Tax=Dactylosporangium sp. CA-152071 TaxID=3239933 RepID=UPI003D93E52C
MLFIRARRKLCQILTVTVAAVACGAVVSSPAAHAGDGYFTGTDLALEAGAPAKGTRNRILGWATPWNNGRHVAYSTACEEDGPYHECGETGIVVASSYGAKRNWTWVSVPAEAGKPPEHGFTFYDAVAYAYDAYGLSRDRGSAMIIKDWDFHIWNLWTSEAQPTWHLVDLTALTGAPPGDGITAYVQGNAQHVIYTGLDSAVWELLYTPWSGWKARNLSALTGTAGTGAWPAATLLGDQQIVAYENLTDSRIHLLVNDGFGWIDRSVSDNTTAQSPYSSLLGIVAAPWSGRVAITYCDRSDHLHELSSADGTSWKDLDLSQELNYFPADCVPPRHTSVALEADGSERHFIWPGPSRWTGGENNITELVRDRNGTRYRWLDRDDVDNFVCAFASQEGPRVDTVWIAYRTQANPAHVIVEDMTVPYA